VELVTKSNIGIAASAATETKAHTNKCVMGSVKSMLVSYAHRQMTPTIPGCRPPYTPR
jgi:hypothetical protein